MAVKQKKKAAVKKNRPAKKKTAPKKKQTAQKEKRSSPLFFLSWYFWAKLALCLGLLALWVPVLIPDTIYSKAEYGSIKEQVINVLDDSLYPLQDTQKLRRYLGLEPDAFESIEFFRTDDAMNAEELLLVKFAEGTDLTSLKNAVSARVGSQSSTYEGYAPEQKDMVDKNVQDYQGNYALYYVGDEPEKVDEVFQKALKEQ